MELLLQVFALLAYFVGTATCSSVCFDHQSTDYKAQFQPAGCNKKCTVTPFFSPDHSLDTYLDLIQSATEAIDIYTPGFNSWSKCTQFSDECYTCVGCSIEDQKNEEFPIFAAILNAVHQKGIKVRLLTNNYTQTTCKGAINPLDWLYLNDVQIHFYTTTTFMHSKVVIVDKGKQTSISSVNFSKTSFTKNREAGVVIENCNCDALDLYQSVFQYDWDNGLDYLLDASYSTADMAIIKDSTPMDIPSTSYPKIAGGYITKKRSYDGVTVTKGYVSPDGALDVMLSDLSNTKSSLKIAIYQITDKTICNRVLELFKSGVNISIIVSARVVSDIDWKLSQECYSTLYNNGMQGLIRNALTKFSFAHQKYWIIDGNAVHLSTGNWSPSDFPQGSTFVPHTSHNVNRDLLVSMEGSDIARAFQTVFENDWKTGTKMVP